MAANASERIVRVVLVVDDKGSARVLNATAAAAENTQGKLEKLKTVGRGMSSVGRSMTSMSLPLVALGAYAVKSAANFQSSMERIRTQAGATQTQVGQLSRGVMGMAGSVGTSPNDLAQGMYHVASSLNATIPAAKRSSTELSVLKIAAQGARVGGANLVDVTNALDGAIVSGMKGVQNYSQAMGVLNSTVGAGDMSMQDLADAFGTGLTGPMATFGVSLKSVGAALAVFGDNNMRGADAGTKLGAAIRIMAASSTAGTKALAGIGISQFQLGNDLRKPNGLVGALTDLQNHLKLSGLGKTQQAAVLTNAFGRKQATGVELLLRQLDRLRAKYAQTGQGAHKFGSDVAAYNQTAAAKFARLRATADVALIGVGNAILPIATKFLPLLAHGITTVAHLFTSLPSSVKIGIVAFVAFLAIGGPILMFLGSLVSAIGSVGMALQFLAANPVVLIIAALVAAGIALVVLYEKCQTFRMIVQAVFTATGMVVSGVVAGIVATFNGLIAFFAAIPKAIGLAFSTVGQAITAPFRMAFNWILGAVHTVLQALVAVNRALGGVPGDFLEVGSAIAHGVGSILGGGPANFTPTFHVPGSANYRLSSRTPVGSQPGNAINQTGHNAHRGGAGSDMPIILHHTTRLGSRVVTEETVHYSAKRTSLGAAVLAH